MRQKDQRPIVRLFERPCGFGKTMFARETIADAFIQGTGQRFVYVAPTTDLIDKFGEQLRNRVTESGAIRKSSLAEAALFSGVHSNQESSRPVKTRLNDPQALLPNAHCIGVSHQSIANVPPEILKDRIVFIDEVPNMLEIRQIDAQTWKALGAPLSSQPGDDPHVQVDDGGWVNVTKLGRQLLASRHGDPMTTATRDLVRLVEHTIRLPSGAVLDGFGPELLTYAKEVWILAADMQAKYLPQWLAMFKVQVQREPDDPTACHAFPDAEIFYLFNRDELPSRHKLEDKQGALARYLGGQLKKVRAANGSLAKIGTFLWSSNVNGRGGVNLKNLLGAHLNDGKFVSPGEFGSNDYIDYSTVIYLAVTRPSPGEWIAISAIPQIAAAQSLKEIEEARHLHNLYQIVMRCRLRDRDRAGTGAGVRILVLTRFEAEWLAKKLGTTKIALASPNANENLAKKNGGQGRRRRQPTDIPAGTRKRETA